jgi:hypothetical protein
MPCAIDDGAVWAFKLMTVEAPTKHEACYEHGAGVHSLMIEALMRIMSVRKFVQFINEREALASRRLHKCHSFV